METTRALGALRAPVSVLEYRELRDSDNDATGGVKTIESRKREHSRKPDEQYELIESCSPGPYLELFARHAREGWSAWGNEASEEQPRGKPHKGYAGGPITRDLVKVS